MRASDVDRRTAREGFEFTLSVRGARQRRVRCSLPGAHLVTNALAAAAVCLSDGFALDEVVAGLEALRDSPRMRVVALANGVTLLDDTYNANPASMAAALDLLGETAGASRRAARRHARTRAPQRPRSTARSAQHAARGRRCALHGRRPGRERGRAARAAGLAQIATSSPSRRPRGALPRRCSPGDVLLVKGSRALALEGVAANLEAADRGGLVSYSLLVGVLAFVVSLAAGGPVVRLLRARKMGKAISELGPSSHQSKAGTPTMGGLLIWGTVAAVTIPTNLAGRLSMLLPLSVLLATVSDRRLRRPRHAARPTRSTAGCPGG